MAAHADQEAGHPMGRVGPPYVLWRLFHFARIKLDRSRLSKLISANVAFEQGMRALKTDVCIASSLLAKGWSVLAS